MKRYGNTYVDDKSDIDDILLNMGLAMGCQLLLRSDGQ